MQKLSHPRDWKLERVQGRFCWIVSFTQQHGYLFYRRVGWR